jgi:hypothetical protein
MLHMRKKPESRNHVQWEHCMGETVNRDYITFFVGRIKYKMNRIINASSYTCTNFQPTLSFFLHNSLKRHPSRWGIINITQKNNQLVKWMHTYIKNLQHLCFNCKWRLACFKQNFDWFFTIFFHHIPTSFLFICLPDKTKGFNLGMQIWYRMQRLENRLENNCNKS